MPHYQPIRADPILPHRHECARDGAPQNRDRQKQFYDCQQQYWYEPDNRVDREAAEEGNSTEIAEKYFHYHPEHRLRCCILA